MQLREYQIKLIDKAREQMLSGIKSVLIQAPTGAGKTVLTAHMLKTAANKGMPSLFIVHRRELIKQSTLTFSAVGVKHGIIASGFPMDLRPMTQIASVQTLAKRLDRIREPRLIIWDECSHVAAAGWGKVHDFYNKSFHIGITATPCRLDGKGLAKYFEAMVLGPSVRWLIDNGFLCDYKLYAPSTISTEGIRTSMGDFARNELNSAADKPSITGDAIKHYKKLTNGKRAVVFCVSIEHSKHVAAQFNAAGIPAAHVDGETPTEERDEKIEQFRSGNILVLCNVELFGEGFDLPALETAILLRPTQSLSLYLQQVGRALRTFENKKIATILDHAGNCFRHGLPDEHRTWDLQGIDKKAQEKSQTQVKLCRQCFAAMRSFIKKCPHCGYVFDVQAREIEHKDGDLKEVDYDQMRRMRLKEQGQAQTREQLLEIAQKRGYKHPHRWVYYIMQARQSKKNAGI